MWAPLYSVKLTDFVVLLVPGLYKIHADASRSLAQDSCHRWLIHQLDIILALVRIVLASG